VAYRRVHPSVGRRSVVVAFIKFTLVNLKEFSKFSRRLVSKTRSQMQSLSV
jgi:hypothetical protein